MKLADGIRKHGFKRWYERELLSGHAHLVLTLLCAIGLMVAFEGFFTFHGLTDKLMDVVSIALCGLVGVWALRRYLYLLAHAEHIAHQAECPGCGSYARFVLVGADSRGLQVRCRRCERVWPIRE